MHIQYTHTHTHTHTNTQTHTNIHVPQCCPWQRWQGSWDPACSRRVSGGGAALDLRIGWWSAPGFCSGKKQKHILIWADTSEISYTPADHNKYSVHVKHNMYTMCGLISYDVGRKMSKYIPRIMYTQPGTWSTGRVVSCILNLHVRAY